MEKIILISALFSEQCSPIPHYGKMKRITTTTWSTFLPAISPWSEFCPPPSGNSTVSSHITSQPDTWGDESPYTQHDGHDHRSQQDHHLDDDA